jgi:alginate O-acetyltransferase complex protein AlgI
MLFHSSQYLFYFLPIVFVLYYFRFKNFQFSKIFILSISSIIFYSAWNIYFLPLILFIIFFNYYFCRFLMSKNNILFYLISFNILILIIFKYLDFFINNINLLFNTQLELLDLPFPLALSFVTFQIIAFLVDVYDGNIKKIDFQKFFLFIIFFPQLIAGPIVRYNHIVPQYSLKNNQKINFNNISIGFFLILIGFLKKILIADNLGQFVDIAFDNITAVSFLESWLISISFTFQIYFDFTGYVDMATGSAILFNIKLPQNFDSPFKATSLINFWQRWHITLTNFLTNYIFNPSVKALKKINFLKMMLLIIMVFIICGFWHGPSWMYGFFGLLHGLGLVVNHFYNKFLNFKLPKLIGWVLTFGYVNFTFIFFRAQDFNDGLLITSKMLGLNRFGEGILLNKELYMLITIIIFCFIINTFFKNSYELFKKYLNFSKDSY